MAKMRHYGARVKEQTRTRGLLETGEDSLTSGAPTEHSKTLAIVFCYFGYVYDVYDSVLVKVSCLVPIRVSWL